MTDSPHRPLNPRCMTQNPSLTQPQEVGERSLPLRRDQHPLTPLLMVAHVGYVPKQYVRKMNGYFHLLRPFWKAKWGCWCVRDGGPQEIIKDERGDWSAQ